MSDVAARTATPVVDASAAEILRARAEALASRTEEPAAVDVLALLLVRIGDEWYAARTDDVREIVQDLAVTPLPCVPDHVLGVTNIRGEIVSVLDSAAMLGIERTDPVATHVAVVLHGGSGSTALAVDDVGDIVDVPKSSLEPPVSILSRARSDYVAGSVCLDDKIVGLLDAGRVLVPIDADREG